MVQLILMKGHFKENTVVYTKIKVRNKNIKDDVFYECVRFNFFWLLDN